MALASARSDTVSDLVVPLLVFFAGSAAGVYYIYQQRWGLVFELSWVLLLACLVAIYLDRNYLR